MLPVGDDNSEITSVPYINYILIALNVVVFVFLQGLDANNAFTYAWSTVPQEIVTGRDVVTESRVVTDEASGQRYRVPGLEPTPVSVYLTLLVSMFMHGSIAHIFGNMLYLLIFGDNVEHRLGHVRYLIFYLLCGVIASLAHVASQVMFNGDLLTPSLGASGAISGVLGAYLILFPHKRVAVLIFRFVQQVPALIAVGIWFVFQLLSSLGLFGDGDGVAYAAHVGGFLAGLALAKLFAMGRPAAGYV